MIKSSNKIKRGAEYIYNGKSVFVEISRSNGTLLVCDNELRGIEHDFFDVALDDLKPVKAQPNEINKVSDSKKQDDKIYNTLRVVYLENHPKCEAGLPGCNRKANQIHHRAGRVGKNYIDIHTFLASCDPCHKWIESHPVKAKELGFSTDRL